MIYQNACKMLLVATSVLITSSSSAQTTAATPVSGHYMPWKPIKEKEIVSKTRLWEDISLSDGHNALFALANSRNPLLKTLVDCIIDGKITAYPSADGRFTHAFTTDEFLQDFRNRQLPGSRVTKFAIKEDSLYINTGEATVRIVGLAPIIATTLPDGTVKEEPMFWVYYPDCRPFLAERKVDGDITWDDIFEEQNFTAQVTRSSRSFSQNNVPGNVR